MKFEYAFFDNLKKILLIFFSLLILFNSSGYILLITHYQSEFRKEKNLHNHQYNINTTNDLTRHLTIKSSYPLYNPYYVLLNPYNNITFEGGLYGG